MRIESALVGLVNFYPVMKPDAQSMTSLAYCGMRHIPCRPRPEASLPDPSPWSPNAFHPREALDVFDYVFVRSPPLLLDVFGAAGDAVELVTHEGSWWLYRKLRRARAAVPQ